MLAELLLELLPLELAGAPPAGVAAAGANGNARYFARKSRRLRDVLQNFRRFYAFLDVFGCVRMHSDAFGYIRMRSDAFGCVWMRSEISENFWKFSGANLYSVDDSERVGRFSEAFGRVRMHADAFGCIRKFLEASGNFRIF